jgi:tetratricopeptide (TPR) repeat protein
MIVKDESENLADCIASVRDAVDEICIVDTGSQDNTLEIARDVGARTHVFLWCNDFAAARNESVQMCTGDWLFVLDPDERVAQEDLEKIRALSRGPRDVCYRFTTRNYTNSDSVADFRPCAKDDPYARGFTGWYPSAKVRFFPSGSGGEFEGKIHELIDASLERVGLRRIDSDIPIHHYALLKSQERLRQKQEMYLKLGHDKAKADPTDPKALTELGNQYAEVRDYENAAGAFREALQLDSSNPKTWQDLGGVLHLIGRSDEAERALTIALELNPGLPDAWRNLGIVCVDRKEWQQAVDCFQQALTLAPEWGDGHRYLSTALQGAGRLEEAAHEARQALEAIPNSIPCLTLYVHQMLRLERRSEARDTLIAIVENHPDLHDVRNVIGELFFYDNLLEDAKHHFRVAGEAGLSAAYNNLGVVFFREQKYEDARGAFEKCLELDPGHKGARSNLSKVMAHLGS